MKGSIRRRLLFPFLTAIVVLIAACGETIFEPVAVEPVESLEGFEASLDDVQVQLQVPGMAAAIAEGDNIVWSRGFGFADVENGPAATDTTSFYVASVTQSVAAIVMMQLVEEGLDDPIGDYAVELESNGVVTVKHVFNHTSQGTPGTRFRYNGNRYITLGDVVREASGKTFSQLITERILRPLELRHTRATSTYWETSP